ncbi:ABC transporter permease subunit [Halopseudomonas bauzanensis]|uniref:ABC transporter permease subunit n=1 Tax=Halopseudomonas bauzanensis TaxID=653930 RepID=A0A031MEH5_9GAMM|nr:ABC transporter permease subunit [Halopseudomonas bauzanensis]EZQ18169.1 phosphate ABC transporter permease [Halopseudomonas bauzanensis]TKA92941.1 ABC transporter permease subunit [Halopseudomonas bauzanensis]SER84195.1 phosphate transport system permease protein [Halopseudomonas bauzanensis]SFL95742.1 phosphate transport system permease protein [Halopseudomonas bauzanensis]
MNMQSSPQDTRIDFDTKAMQRHRKVRHFKDHFTRWYVAVGGLGVIAAILLIFLYLLSEVLPLFSGADLEERTRYQPAWAANSGAPLMLAMEEQAEVGVRLAESGQLAFFQTADGALISEQQLPIPDGAQITSFNVESPTSRQFVVGLSNGQVIIGRHDYRVTYPEDRRLITPSLVFPYGSEPLTLDEQGRALDSVTMRVNGDNMALIGSVGRNLVYTRISSRENLMTGEVSVDQQQIPLAPVSGDIQKVLVDPLLQWMYVFNGNQYVNVYALRQDGALLERYPVVEGADRKVTAANLLLGGISLIIGDNEGNLNQWFMVRGEGTSKLTLVRSFDAQKGTAITDIQGEERRKVFLAADEKGRLGFYNTTAHQNLMVESVDDRSVAAYSIGPRAADLLVEHTDGQISAWKVDNPHPEISWSALWGKVWYESYPEPDYVWQSSSGSTEFEPKLSLAPLTFGTLKAAFYAMILATPLAIAAAVYTAYFMAPAMRRKVKPIIELMEALPTVILGFLAGLWLAPLLETNLPGIVSLLILTPIAFIAFAFAWSKMPEKVRFVVPDGWEALLLVPVLLIIGWFSFEMSIYLEAWFFGGDMRMYLTHDLGIDFDQRNALVVGLAMGFAVIPTIYSIAEDAVFSVPRHLTQGSLALGATPWQTMSRVVILTASPGIFSAVMIGMGRAVGETMIVLMATGNTAIMDMNIFEGMRTLSANIAVEMPESEVGSTHYRVLFLAALVLLSFTFVMNTLAELIRQRLRKKYASL